MQFNIITIFPDLFNSYLEESLIKKAREKGLIKVNIHNLRKWAEDKHQSVDDRPYGGGLGMVLKPEPIYKAVKEIKKNLKNKAAKSKVILFTPRGKKFNQKMAFDFSKLDSLILICGRYEGVDERVSKHVADIELSIGDYDLMGGELPAMIIIETVSRLIPGVLGKPNFLKERVTKTKGFIEYPQYTRPEIFQPFLRQGSGGQAKKGKKWRVPKVLLSGDHKEIEAWRLKRGKVIEK